MKQIRLLVFAAVCGAALLLTTKANAQAAGVATVIRIHGSASYSTGGDTWQPLAVGMTLEAGASIKTDPDSSVDLVLSDHVVNANAMVNGTPSYPAVDASGAPMRQAGINNVLVEQNVVRLTGGTTLMIDKLTYEGTGADMVSDTELSLQAGHIFGSVKKLSAMSKYEIKTPVGVAGIRGTTYWIGSDGSAAVGTGSMVISFSGGPLAGQVITLNGGLEVDSTTGQILAINGNISDELKSQIQQNYTVQNVANALDVTTIYTSAVTGSD
jgi:FecR protein